MPTDVTKLKIKQIIQNLYLMTDRAFSWLILSIQSDLGVLYQASYALLYTVESHRNVILESLHHDTGACNSCQMSPMNSCACQCPNVPMESERDLSCGLDFLIANQNTFINLLGEELQNLVSVIKYSVVNM